jgi:hypothetical protein
VENRKICCLCLESNPGRKARSPYLYLLSFPGSDVHDSQKESQPTSRIAASTTAQLLPYSPHVFSYATQGQGIKSRLAATLL